MSVTMKCTSTLSHLPLNYCRLTYVRLSSPPFIINKYHVMGFNCVTYIIARGDARFRVGLGGVCLLPTQNVILINKSRFILVFVLFSTCKFEFAIIMNLFVQNNTRNVYNAQYSVEWDIKAWSTYRCPKLSLIIKTQKITSLNNCYS